MSPRQPDTDSGFLDGLGPAMTMDEQHIRDNHVIDRYLLGQLSEEELVGFELYYFEHPEVLDEITLAKSMHRGIHANLASEPARPVFGKFVAWLTTPAWSMAATAAAATFAALLIFQPIRGPIDSSAGAQNVVGEGMLLQYRAAAPPTEPHIELPAITNSVGLVVLTVDVADLGNGELAVELIQLPDKQKLTSLRLTANREGLAIIALPAGLFSSEQFLLRATNNSGLSHEYPFGVVRN